MSAASRLNSGALPFDIDKELEDEFSKMKADSDSLFPVRAHTPPIPAHLSPRGRATSSTSACAGQTCFCPVSHFMLVVPCARM